MAVRICEVMGCDRQSVKRDMCDRHYLRFKRARAPARAAQGIIRKCEAEGCDRPHMAKGMCGMHYQRAKAATCAATAAAGAAALTA